MIRIGRNGEPAIRHRRIGIDRKTLRGSSRPIFNRTKQPTGAALLREFLALFDGLASTTRRGKILTELGLNRAVLADLLCDGAPDREAIDALLQAMRAATKPIKPPRLGIIGETNLRRRLGAFGDADSFRYARAIGFDHEGLPYIVEGAFVWTPNQTHRQLILGVNFASAPSLSIDLGLVETVGTLLAERHAGQYEPVAALLHVVHPRPTFTDLGKTQLSLPLRGARGSAQGGREGQR